MTLGGHAASDKPGSNGWNHPDFTSTLLKIEGKGADLQLASSQLADIQQTRIYVGDKWYSLLIGDSKIHRKAKENLRGRNPTLTCKNDVVWFFTKIFYFSCRFYLILSRRRSIFTPLRFSQVFRFIMFLQNIVPSLGVIWIETSLDRFFWPIRFDLAKTSIQSKQTQVKSCQNWKFSSFKNIFREEKYSDDEIDQKLFLSNCYFDGNSKLNRCCQFGLNAWRQPATSRCLAQQCPKHQK